MRSIRVATLCVVVVSAFAPLPVHAQGSGASNNLLARVEALEAAVASEAAARAAGDSTLQANINNENAARGAADATLQAQIDTLKGNITASDLEGTYNFYFIATALDPAAAGTNIIASYVITGTVMLGAGGTGHASAFVASGRQLTEQTPSQNWVGAGFSGFPVSGEADISWAYSNGTVTFGCPGDCTVFTPAGNGQVMVGVQGGPPGNNQAIMVLTRQPSSSIP